MAKGTHMSLHRRSAATVRAAAHKDRRPRVRMSMFSADRRRAIRALCSSHPRSPAHGPVAERSSCEVAAEIGCVGAKSLLQ